MSRFSRPQRDRSVQHQSGQIGEPDASDRLSRVLLLTRFNVAECLGERWKANCRLHTAGTLAFKFMFNYANDVTLFYLH